MITTPQNSGTTPSPLAVNAFLRQPHFQQFNPQGNLHFSIRAIEAKYHTRHNTAEFQSPSILIFTQNQVSWRISADHGVSENIGTTDKKADKEKIYLFGHVILHRPSQPQSAETTISTSALTIYPQRSFAETNQNVTITQPGTIIHGQGVTANLKTNTIKLLKHSRGTYEAPANS